jgi:hypothetical protein
MYAMLAGLKDYFKRQEFITDNPIFRIHCSFTTVLLLFCSMVITWTQFVGNPIKCIVDGVPPHVVNTYCWIMTTFTMPDAFRRPEGSIAHPGVENGFDDLNRQKHYTYYQWVCFVLFFQAILCYFPKWLWETWEQNLMKTIVCGLNIGLRSEEEKQQKKSVLIDYLIKHLNQHNMYAFRYWFCELLCFINIIFQMYMMDWFFQGDFMTYGANALLTAGDEDQDNRYDHMVYVFPRVTKCTFRKFGPTATIEKHDAICILPLNIVNEKTYIFLWFWFICLAVLTGLVIVFRSVVIACPSLRPRLMHARNRMVPADAIDSVSRKVSVGDWWVLYMLGLNIDPQIYRDVIAEFAKKNDTAHSNNPKLA